MRQLQLLLFSILLLLPTMLSAAEQQDGLRIKEVFTRYGDKKNAVMIELSDYTTFESHVNLYRSITIRKNSTALKMVRECLKADTRNAKELRKVTSDGDVVSAQYQLPKKDNLDRYIVFNINKDEDITIIYIDGNIQSHTLIDTLKIIIKDFYNK